MHTREICFPERYFCICAGFGWDRVNFLHSR